MQSDQTQPTAQAPVDQSMTVIQVMDRLSRFEGPSNEFLMSLLTLQCQLAGALEGAILRSSPNGQPEVLALYPPVQAGTKGPAWLAASVEAVQRSGPELKTLIMPLNGISRQMGHSPRAHLINVPLYGDGGIRGMVSCLVDTDDRKQLSARQVRLELSISLLSAYETRLLLQQRKLDAQRILRASQTLTETMQHERFTAAAMAFCNEVATRWTFDRVSLGFLKGRYVQVRAMNNTEKFSRKMKLVQDIEAAMEECLDQDLEICHPALPEDTTVNRAAGELSQRHGQKCVWNLPLHRKGTPVAVLTVECPQDQAIKPEQIESLRLACELSAGHLVGLYERDRWLGAKAARGLQKACAWIVGTKHTWAKVTALLALAVVIFLAFAKGDYRAESSFILEATERRMRPAPFDGFLKSVAVVPGDLVESDKTVLAALDTAELELQLAASKAEYASHLKQAAVAMDEEDNAAAQTAQSDAKKVAAQMALTRHRIEQATILSGVRGYVVSGDLKKRLGTPVQTGDPLFEIAALESLRAVLYVPDDRITDVRVGQSGELATASHPETKIEFTVERINPIAEVINQRNVFRVRVDLAERPDWFRPGMEGVGKITVGHRHYAWMWTRKMVNWVRMKLWI